MRVSILPIGLALGAALMAGPAQAQIDDHMRCYKIKDTQKLKGTVGIDTAQFGLADNCKISKASLLCVPARKFNASVVDHGTNIPVTPLPLSALPSPGDQLCYKVKCRGIPPPDTVVTDQFGTRLVTKLKGHLLCTPAVKGTEFCGDSVINGSEVCEPRDDSACPGLCQADCSCPTAGPFCGDAFLNGSEECEPTADSACPGLCQPDCSCPLCLPGAEEVGGACWYLGGGGESCDTVCANAGLSYDTATATYAGSGGSLLQCFEVLNALGDTSAPGADVDCGGDGLGCTERGFVRDRCVTPPTDSTSSQGGAVRACACQ